MTKQEMEQIIEKKIDDIKGRLEIKALNKISSIIFVENWFTVGTDKQGKICLENTEYPTFFEQKTAEEIKKHIEKNNPNKKVEIISEHEFLKKLLNNYTELLNNLTKIGE